MIQHEVFIFSRPILRSCYPVAVLSRIKYESFVSSFCLKNTCFSLIVSVLCRHLLSLQDNDNSCMGQIGFFRLFITVMSG